MSDVVAGVALSVECRTCLRYVPGERYCGHSLRVIGKGEGVICAGRGYSPKGSPWKDVSPLDSNEEPKVRSKVLPLPDCRQRKAKIQAIKSNKELTR